MATSLRRTLVLLDWRLSFYRSEDCEEDYSEPQRPLHETLLEKSGFLINLFQDKTLGCRFTCRLYKMLVMLL
ncbi:hypothetical protein BH11BAC6_BH11BAC6_07720 [soil metagenome]